MKKGWVNIPYICNCMELKTILNKWQVHVAGEYDALDNYGQMIYREIVWKKA